MIIYNCNNREDKRDSRIRDIVKISDSRLIEIL